MSSSTSKTIRVARCRLGLTQAEAAAASGVSLDTWYSWECGRRTPRLKYVSAIARTLKLTGLETDTLTVRRLETPTTKVKKIW